MVFFEFVAVVVGEPHFGFVAHVDLVEIVLSWVKDVGAVQGVLK